MGALTVEDCTSYSNISNNNFLTLTGENVFHTDLCHKGSHTEITSFACSRNEVLLLRIQQGLLCDVVGTESARKTRPCCRRGNGKMLLGALQEVCMSHCVRATQRKRGKSSRWLSDASFISGSHNNGESLLSSSNKQQDKQERWIPKRDFHHVSVFVLEKNWKVNCLYSAEWYQHCICHLKWS